MFISTSKAAAFLFRLHLLERWREILPADSRVAAILELVADRKIPISYAKRKVMDSMVDNRPHQVGVVNVSMFRLLTVSVVGHLFGSRGITFSGNE